MPHNPGMKYPPYIEGLRVETIVLARAVSAARCAGPKSNAGTTSIWTRDS